MPPFLFFGDHRWRYPSRFIMPVYCHNRPSPLHDGDQHRCLFLRPAKPVAARVEREYQWPAETVLSKGHRLVGAFASPSEQVARQLNERPRETLQFETPAERFNACVASTG